MKMKDILARMQESKFVKVANEDYYLQAYSARKQGNIKRQDGTVLIRYRVINGKIFVAFAKANSPKEFDYKNYGIDLGADAIEVKKISHENATELYRVLVALGSN
jgi:hypothetical protein